MKSSFSSSEPSSDRDLIRKANSVDLLSVFKKYGIEINEHIKIQCPLPGHNDRTPSFGYFENGRNFYCFGCKASGRAVEITALLENISKVEAAKLILSKFTPDLTDINNSYLDEIEKQKYYIQFSTFIREYLQQDKSSFDRIDKICTIYDSITEKHKLDVLGYKSLIDKLMASLKKKD